MTESRILNGCLTRDAAMIKEGTLIAIFTDSVYALAASVDSPDKLERIFRVKHRDPDGYMGISLLLPNMETLANAGPNLSDLLRTFLKQSCPYLSDFVVRKGQGHDIADSRYISTTGTTPTRMDSLLLQAGIRGHKCVLEQGKIADSRYMSTAGTTPTRMDSLLLQAAMRGHRCVLEQGKIAGPRYISTTETMTDIMNGLVQSILEVRRCYVSDIKKIADSRYMSTTGTMPSRMNRLEQESLKGDISHSELEKLQELISELLKKIRDNDSKAFMAKADNRISKKDDLNQTVNDRLTLLMCACYHSRKDIVKFLLDRGCDVNLKSNPQWTALMFAAHAGSAEIVKLLLDKGAKINDVNSLGSTALILATSKGHKEVVEFLLNKGADKGIVNNAGWTAQEIAEEKGFEDIASLFN